MIAFGRGNGLRAHWRGAVDSPKLTRVSTGSSTWGIAWQTYTPDGRSLTVDRSPAGEWLLRCDDAPEQRGVDLASSMPAAVELDESATIGGDREARMSWIREQASRIVAEAGP